MMEHVMEHVMENDGNTLEAAKIYGNPRDGT